MEKIAYVDECGIDTYLYREYGYASRGQKVFSRIRGRKYKRCGIVAAQMNGRILAPLQYDGTMDPRRPLASPEPEFSPATHPAMDPGRLI